MLGFVQQRAGTTCNYMTTLKSPCTNWTQGEVAWLSERLGDFWRGCVSFEKVGWTQLQNINKIQQDQWLIYWLKGGNMIGVKHKKHYEEIGAFDYVPMTEVTVLSYHFIIVTICFSA